MKDPKEEQWYFNNITDIGPSSVSYFDVHDFDIYSIFVCVLYDSEVNTNKHRNHLWHIPNILHCLRSETDQINFIFVCVCLPTYKIVPNPLAHC